MDELSALLAAAKAGDEAAFAQFVRRSQAEVWRFCDFLVGTALADDATQETFVEAWRSLGAFRGESSARTWLLVIARRTAGRLSRRHRRARQLDSAAPLRSERDPAQWNELDLMISKLDEDRRLAILLTQLLGLSYAEAADVCGCPIGTIRSRVARARQDLLALQMTGVETSSPRARKG